MKNVFGNLVLVVLALSFGSGVWFQARANAALQAEQLRLKSKASELGRLRKLQVQNEADTAEKSREMQSETVEAARLRASIEVMRNRLIGAKKVILPADANKNDQPWSDAGRASPDDTMHSAIWAALNGDTDALATMIAFEPESLAVAEDLFASLPEPTRAQYGSAEKLIAMMMSGRMPLNLGVANLVEQTNETPAIANVKFQLKDSSSGLARDVTFRFQRAGAGWRLLVPKAVVAEFQQSLQSR